MVRYNPNIWQQRLKNVTELTVGTTQLTHMWLHFNLSGVDCHQGAVRHIQSDSDAENIYDCE